MLDLQAFRNIANNTSVSDRKFVYFANGVDDNGKKIDGKLGLCFNAAGKPRGFKRPEGLERQQDSIFMRNQLLDLARIRLGGTESNAFKEIEKKLFGKLVGGQFEPKTASTPLRKRDIVSVLKVLDAADAAKTEAAGVNWDNAPQFAKVMNRAGKFVSFGPNVNPELKSRLEKSSKKMEIHNGFLYSDVHDAVGTVLKGIDGHSKMPRQYEQDESRIECLETSNGKTLKTVASGNPSAETVENTVVRDEIARLVTGDESATFANLTGKDLKKAQFFMANTCRGASRYFAKDVLMGGFSPLTSPGSAKTVYGIHRTKDGGVRFSATISNNVASVEKDDKKYIVNSEKSYKASTFEIEYSAETLEKICDHNWLESDNSFLKPDKQNSYCYLHLE